MKLRWRKLDNALKRRVRAEVRNTPALRTEYQAHRRGRRWWNVRLPPGFNRLIYWGAALVFLGRNIVPLESLTVFLWLWALGAMFWRTASLQSTLYFAGELNLFRHLPLADGEIFEIQWRRFLRSSVWPALDFALLYGVLAYRLGAGWQSPVIGLGLGALQAACNVLFAVALFAGGFRRGLPWLALLSFGSALGLLLFGSGVPAFIAVLHPATGWFPPAGWIIYALGLSPTGGLWGDLLPNICAGLGLAALPLALQRLRRRYVLTEEVFDQAFRLTAAGEAGALRLQEYAEQFTRETSDVVANVQAGALRERLNWEKAGMIERWVGRCLTKREQAVVEFLTASNPGWTKDFRTMLFLSLTALVAVKLFPAIVGFSFGVFFFFAAVLWLGLGVKFWRGFGPSAPIGLPPPYYAFLPLGFRELHRCVMKVMFLRYLIATPVLAVVIWGFSHGLNVAGDNLWIVVGKLWVLGLIAHPAVAIFPFSTSSNDTDHWWFSIPTLFLILVLIGLGAGFVLVPHWLAVGGFSVGFALLAFGSRWLYQRSYDQDHFDLLPSKRSDSTAQHSRP